MELMVITAAVFGLVVSSVFLLVTPRGATGQELVRRRLDRIGGGAAEKEVAADHGTEQAGFFAELARCTLGNKQSGGTGYTAMRRLLYQAGYPGEHAVQAFWGVRLTLMAGAGGFAALVAFSGEPSLPKLLLHLGFGSLAGFILPRFYLQRRASGRKRQLQEALPDTLDLLVVCTEAGMGLDAAFVRVGLEQAASGFAIGEEFQLMAREVQAGVPRREAISRLADRLDIDDFRSLASFLIQTEEFGGSIARSLRVFAQQMRQKRSQKAEELARKAVIKLIFPVVLFILPALFLVALAPVSVNVMASLAG